MVIQQLQDEIAALVHSHDIDHCIKIHETHVSQHIVHHELDMLQRGFAAFDAIDPLNDGSRGMNEASTWSSIPVLFTQCTAKFVRIDGLARIRHHDCHIFLFKFVDCFG